MSGLAYGITLRYDGSTVVGGITAATNAFDRFKGSVDQAGNAADKAGKQGKGAGDNIKDAGDKAASSAASYDRLTSSIGGLIVKLAAAVGLAASVSHGLNTNAAFEDATAGMAAMISAQNTITNQQGEILSGQQAYNAALALSQDQVAKLQIDGLATTATFKELTSVYQSVLGPAQALGLTLDQSRQVTVGMVQAAGAMKIPMTEVETATKQILTGTINIHNQLAFQLGITNEDVKAWAKKGVLVDELNTRLEAYGVAGERAARTWSGMTAGLAEAFDVVSSKATASMFDEIKQAGLNVFDEIFVAGETGALKLNDGLTALVETLDGGLGALGSVIGEGMEAALDLAMQIGDWIGESRAELGEISTASGMLWNVVKGILSTVISIVGGIVDWGVKSGFFVGVIKTAALLLAGLNDGVNLLGGMIMVAGAKIGEFFLAPMQKFLDILATAAGALGMGKVAEALRNYGEFAESTYATMGEKGAAAMEKIINGGGQVAKVMAEWDAQAKQAGDTHADAANKAAAAVDGLGVASKRVGQAASDAAKTAAAEWAKLVDQVANKAVSGFLNADGWTNAQEKELKALNAALAQGKINLEQFRQAEDKLIKSTAAYQNEQKRLNEELKRADQLYELSMKAVWDLDKAFEDARDNARKEVEALKEQNELYGLTKTQIVELNIAKVEAALVEERLLNVTTKRLIQLEDTLELLKEQRDLTRQLEIKEEYSKQLDEIADKSKQTAQTIQQSLTDALMRGFENGKGFAQNLKDTLKNLFKTLILQPTIQAIIQPVANGMAGMFGGGAPAQGAGGSSGGMGGVMQIGQSIMGMFGGGGSGTSGWMSSILGFFGGGGGGGTGGGMMGMFGGGGGGMGGVMGGAGMGYGIGSLIGSLGIGHGRHGGSLGSIGGAIGTIWGPIGTVIGSLIGGLIGSLIGRKGGDKTGASAMSEGIEGRYYTPNQQDDVARETITDIEESWAQIAQSLGVSGSNIGFGIGWDTDPKGDAQSRVSGGVYVDGQRVYFNQENLGRDAEKFEEGMALEIQRMLLAAAREVTDGDIKAILGDFDIADATLEEVQQAFADADYWQRAVEPLRGVIEATLGQSFDFAAIDELAREGETLEATMTRLTTVFSATTTAARLVGQSVDDLFGAGLAGTEAREELAARFGGADAMAEAMNYYMQAFRPDEVMLQIFQESGDAIVSMFDNLNMAVPRSREEFDAIVRGLDLTTEAGQELFTSLMQLSPAFNNFVGALDDMSAAMSNTIADMRRSFEFDGLSNTEKYNKLKEEADAAYVAFQTATDPVEIQKQFDVITQNMSEAWGLLTDEQKNAQRAEYLAKLEELEASKDARIDAIKDTYLGVEDATANITTAGNEVARALLGVAEQLGVDISGVRLQDTMPPDDPENTIKPPLEELLTIIKPLLEEEGLLTNIKPLLEEELLTNIKPLLEEAGLLTNIKPPPEEELLTNNKPLLEEAGLLTNIKPLLEEELLTNIKPLLEISTALQEAYNGMSLATKPLLLDDSDPSAAYVAAQQLLQEIQEQQADSSADFSQQVGNAGEGLSKELDKAGNALRVGVDSAATSLDKVTKRLEVLVPQIPERIVNETRLITTSSPSEIS